MTIFMNRKWYFNFVTVSIAIAIVAYALVCLPGCKKSVNYVLPSKDSVSLPSDAYLLSLPYKANLVFLGTSLTYGQGTGNPLVQSWAGQFVALLNDGSAYHNFGIPGAVMSDLINAEVPKAIAVYDTINYTTNIAFVEGGTNDFRNGTSAADIYSSKKKVCQTLKSAGFKVVVVTSPAFNSATSSLNGDPIAVEQIRQDLLVLERQGWKDDMGAQALIDWSADPIFGMYVGNGNQDSTYWFSDGIHFNITGYGLLAQKAVPVILALRLRKTFGTVSQPNDVTLRSLSTTGSGVLVPSSFNPLVNEYVLKLYSNVASTTITPITNNSNATIKINNVPILNGVSVASPLNIGNNYNLIRVENGLNSKIYQIDAIRGSWDLLTQPLDFSLDNHGLSLQPDGWGLAVPSNGYGVTSSALNGDGFIQFMRGYSGGKALGLDLSGTLNSNTDNTGKFTWNYQMYVDNSFELWAYKDNVAADVGNETNNQGYFKLDRTAGVMTIQYSPDNILYTTIYTFPGISSGKLHAKVYIADYGTKFYNLAESGLN